LAVPQVSAVQVFESLQSPPAAQQFAATVDVQVKVASWQVSPLVQGLASAHWALLVQQPWAGLAA
jgi:hypothetical protein